MKSLVNILPNIKQKYVVVRGKYNGEELLFLRGNPDVVWHKEILDKIQEEGVEIKEVMGGGWLFLSKDDNTIYVWGKNSKLGAAPIELVRELLGSNIIEDEPTL